MKRFEYYKIIRATKTQYSIWHTIMRNNDMHCFTCPWYHMKLSNLFSCRKLFFSAIKLFLTVINLNIAMHVSFSQSQMVFQGNGETETHLLHRRCVRSLHMCQKAFHIYYAIFYWIFCLWQRESVWGVSK